MELVGKRVLFIDARNKASGDFNNPVFNLNSQDGFFNCESNQKIMVCPLSFQILNDYYNINDTNNQLVFTINTKSAPSANPINGFVWEVDNGYYDVYSLATYLQLILKSQFKNMYTSLDVTETRCKPDIFVNFEKEKLPLNDRSYDKERFLSSPEHQNYLADLEINKILEK